MKQYRLSRTVLSVGAQGVEVTSIPGNAVDHGGIV